MSTTSKILIADDHPLVASALANLLGREDDLAVVGHVRSFHEIWDALEEHRPDVLILDISMPGGSAVDAIRRIDRRHSHVRVLVLSGLPEEEYVVRMIDAGALGFVQKDSEPATLIEATRRVAAGKTFLSTGGAAALARAARGQGPDHAALSDRELEVLRLLGEGKPVGAIAKELHLSPKTVSTYRTRLMEKMDFGTTAEIIRYAV
ncbi:MAG: response regulator transcription factor, partial [Longimicrobiales bacterium]|nr:response regulator transcription factor [Longimicrobiales bacterium]